MEIVHLQASPAWLRILLPSSVLPRPERRRLENVAVWTQKVRKKPKRNAFENRSGSGLKRMPDAKPKRRIKDGSSKRLINCVYGMKSRFRPNSMSREKNLLQPLNMNMNDKLSRLLNVSRVRLEENFMPAERSPLPSPWRRLLRFGSWAWLAPKMPM